MRMTSTDGDILDEGIESIPPRRQVTSMRPDGSRSHVQTSFEGHIPPKTRGTSGSRPKSL